MCGRLALFSDPREIARLFGLAGMPAMAPRWNVAPRQPVAAIREGDGGRELVPLEWGLLPHWARDATGPRPINARAETVLDKPLFRNAFHNRRCLVPADGWYEWQALPGGKQPWFIAAADRSLLAFAGLWESWRDPDGAELETLTILTTAARGEVATIHARMPVIVPTPHHATWLEGDVHAAGVLMDELPETPLAPREISTRVNNPRNEGPELLAS